MVVGILYITPNHAYLFVSAPEQRAVVRNHLSIMVSFSKVNEK